MMIVDLEAQKGPGSSEWWCYRYFMGLKSVYFTIGRSEITHYLT